MSLNATSKPPTTVNTATSQYQAAFLKAQMLIVELEDALEPHARIQSTPNNRRSYGFAGDLNNLNQRLQEALEAIALGAPRA